MNVQSDPTDSNDLDDSDDLALLGHDANGIMELESNGPSESNRKFLIGD
jgi:hypothetical protein